jgi:hypothetical protein
MAQVSGKTTKRGRSRFLKEKEGNVVSKKTATSPTFYPNSIFGGTWRGRLVASNSRVARTSIL